MNDKKCIKRNHIAFIITICLFALTFGILLIAIISTPIFTMDQGSINILELFGEFIRYFAIAIPYYLSAVIYAISCKRVTDLLSNSNNRFNKVSKVVNTVLMIVITVLLIATVACIYYWN